MSASTLAPVALESDYVFRRSADPVHALMCHGARHLKIKLSNA